MLVIVTIARIVEQRKIISSDRQYCFNTMELLSYVNWSRYVSGQYIKESLVRI